MLTTPRLLRGLSFLVLLVFPASHAPRSEQEHTVSSEHPAPDRGTFSTKSFPNMCHWESVFVGLKVLMKSILGSA